MIMYAYLARRALGDFKPSIFISTKYSHDACIAVYSEVKRNEFKFRSFKGVKQEDDSHIEDGDDVAVCKY